jgi:hypothetical protein
MDDPLKNFDTAKSLADREGCQPFNVWQSIARLRIDPVGFIGNAKLYSKADGERVVAELARLRELRERRARVGGDGPPDAPRPRIGAGLPAIPTLPRRRVGDGAAPVPDAPTVKLIGAGE